MVLTNLFHVDFLEQFGSKLVGLLSLSFLRLDDAFHTLVGPFQQLAVRYGGDVTHALRIGRKLGNFLRKPTYNLKE